MNFAHVKREGEPSAKFLYNKYSFYCHDCMNQWESIPEAEKDYFEYVDLRNRTNIIVRDMGKDGSFGPAQQIDFGELSRRKELARKIMDSYQHMLNIDPGEWYELAQDAAQYE